MATRSRIGIELRRFNSLFIITGMVIRSVGRILNNNISTSATGSRLIDGGDMSTCWTNERWIKDLSFEGD